MSSPSAREVDAAVRAVLRDMKGESRNEVFGEAVLGARHVAGLGDACREVTIGIRTVVTPLAGDELKRRGIAIRRVAVTRAVGDGAWGIAVEDGSGIAVALRSHLLRERETWIDIGSDHSQAAQWVASDPNRRAVLLTAEASIATWHACAVAGLRAATVCSAEPIDRAVHALGTRLIVIEPNGHSLFSLRRMCETFRRESMPPKEVPDADRRSDRPRDALALAPRTEERALRDRLAAAARGAGRGRSGTG